MGILTHRHEAEAEDDFALAVGRRRPTPCLVAHNHRGHVRECHRGPARRFEDDLGDLLHRRRPADAMDDQRVAVLPQHAPADVFVVRLDRVEDAVEGQAEFLNFFGVEFDLDLPLVPAPGVHLGHAGHLAELRPDDPVVDGPQFGYVVALARDDVVKDFAQAR